MANYVDIETSAEALQEDEELIEAVEAAVDFAAESVMNQIQYEISTFLEQVQTTAETAFPVLIEYQQNPARMKQDIRDWSIFLLMYAIAFLLLSPQRRRNKNKSGGNHSGAAVGGGDKNGGRKGNHNRSRSWSNRFRNDSFGSLNDEMMDSAGSSSLNSNTGARFLQALHEEVSDEERFARVYDSLLQSNYSKLILPPTCQLIEKPIASELRQQQAAVEAQKEKEEQRRKRRAEEEEIPDEKDDPAQRLQTYFRHFMVLVRSLFTFDYAGAIWTILLWLQGIHRHRRSQSRERLSSMSSPRHSRADVSSSDDADEGDGRPQIGCRDDESDSVDSVRTSPQQDEKGDAAEKRNAPTISSAAPSTPFATPMTDANNTTIITSSNIGADTPRLPLLESSRHSGNKAVLSPLFEEKKESYSPDDQRRSPLIGSTSPKQLLFLNKRVQDVVQTPVPEGGDDESSVEYELLPPPQPIQQEHTTTSRDSATTVVTANQSMRGSAMELELDPSLQKIESPRASSNSSRSAQDETEENDPQSPRVPVSTTRSSTWYFFETAHSRESLKRMSVEVPVPDRHGYVLGDEYLPDDRSTPLLVFVNSRSGPQQGHLLITQLRRLLNPIQIWDLANGPPEPILESFLVISKLRILVCGGDGTVSWIISALDSLNLKQRKWPPIAILPLGTGNDLARVHGWGAGYNNESLISILEQISESYISILDRWELTVESQGGKKRVTSTKNFFNYFSVGVDAEAALQVHYLRERRPEWFFSRFINKAWYGVLSAEESIKGNSVNVRREIVLYADGVHVPLPKDSQGLIVLNIDSYAGGVPLWTYGVNGPTSGRSSGIRRSQSMSAGMRFTRKDSLDRVDSSDDLSAQMSEEEIFSRVTACDRQASCQDGLLDIVSVRGLVHLGQCKVGIGNAQRLAQCREIKIVIKKKVAVQIDGEPWRQKECILHIKRKKDPALMLHRSADDGGIETEMSKLLDWAEDRHLIDGQVHTVLMKEFSRRIETKTRQRRQEQNVIQNLKRAIGSTGAMSAMANPTSQQHNTTTRSHVLPYNMEAQLGRNEAHGDQSTDKQRSKSMQNLIWASNSWGSTNGGGNSAVNF